MTLLVSWAAVDTHGTTSIYVASDSRITWGNGVTFDRGRKVFAFHNYPDVLGYCGDVLFPSLALSQIVQLGDAGLLFKRHFTGKQKFQAIVDKLNDLVQEYPRLHAGLDDNSLSIVHASRDTDRPSSFSCRTISWLNGTWKGQEAELPNQSDVLFVLGSAGLTFRNNMARYSSGPNRGTSRAVFHCFCDTLRTSSDKSIGGAPQLVGIIRKPASPAKAFGILYQGTRTFLGAHIDNLYNFDAVDWRNENFELCDGLSGRIKDDAQPQPDPLRTS